jgi:hypothetical protein
MKCTGVVERIARHEPCSGLGSAKDMVTKTIDRLTADTVATGTHHTKHAPYPEGDHERVFKQDLNSKTACTLKRQLI